MLIKAGVDGKIPKELWEKVINAVYNLCKWGIPEDGAIEISRIIIENYWREKNANKSGS